MADVQLTKCTTMTSWLATYDTLPEQLLGIDIGARNLQRLMNDNTLFSPFVGTVTTRTQTKAREASDLKEAQSYAREQPHPINSD